MKDNLFALKKLKQAKTWVREAGAFLRDHIHQTLEVSQKSNFSDLVTNFDQHVQEIIIEEISKNYPEDKILADEIQQLLTVVKKIFGFWIRLMVR